MKLLDNEATVLMVQISQSRWEIQTRNGFVLQGDITVSTNHEAEDAVKRYISSYLCWNYKMVPLKKDEK